jgi:TPR repeat protein
MQQIFFKKTRAWYAERKARFLARSTEWQYKQAQADDATIWESDPRKDQMREAHAAFKAAPEVGFQRVLAIAEQGSIWSMAWVGWAYSKGRGTLSDIALAEDWYRRAFEGGSHWGLLGYGSSLWLRGDFTKSEEVFGVGAAKDLAPALYWLALCRLHRSNTRNTYREVRPLLERASTKGCLAARYWLAKWMLRGRFGLREILRGHRLMWKLSDVIMAKD